MVRALVVLGLALSAVAGCGSGAGSCGEFDVNRTYVDDLNDFEMFLEHDCATQRLDGTFFDGEDFYDLFGSVLGDVVQIQGDWDSNPFLDIIDRGNILSGEMTLRGGDEIKVRFRAQP